MPPQDGPRGPPDCPRGAQDGPTGPQESLKRGPGGGTRIEISSHPPQGDPETASRPSRSPKEAPRGSKEDPRGSQTIPKMLQTASKRLPRGFPRDFNRHPRETSDPQPKHGGGMGRRPTPQYRAPCGPSSLLPRLSVVRCPMARASRMSPCSPFQRGLHVRGIQKSSFRPRRKPAEGPRKLAEGNRGRCGRRKPAEARLKLAEA